MAIRFQFYRKTAAEWTSANPILLSGELGLETDTGLFKFGNGTSTWTVRPYAGASVGVVPWGAITGTLSEQTDLQAALDAKQATLVSATNIKTINGESILGAGNLVISGGGGGSVAWGAITGTLSAQIDLQTALNAKAPTASPTFTGTVTLPAGQVVNGVTLTTGGGTFNFLRADGTYAAPPGGGGATNLAWDVATSTITSDTGTDATLTLVDGTNPGLMSVADKTKLDAITGTNTGNQTSIVGITGTKAQFDTAVTDGNFLYVGDVTTNATHTGDATGATALTLATVNSNVGSFGLAGSVAQFVVNAKGLITSAVNVAISIAATAISDSTAAGRAMLTAATVAAQTALLDVFTSGAKGLAPASGGGTTNFLRADGTWAAAGGGSPVTVQDEGVNITTALGTMNFVGAGVTVTGGATATVTIPGGSGAPGGVTTQMQFNNAGAFAGASSVLVEGNELRLPAIATPATPAASGLKLYGTTKFGPVDAMLMRPDGKMLPIQTDLGEFNQARYLPHGNSTTALSDGLTINAFTGAATIANIATTNLHTMLRRIESLVTTAATTAVAGIRGAANQYRVGKSAAAPGGFLARIQWAPATGAATATNRAFAGMFPTAAPTDIEPSSRVNIIGMGYDAADANIQIMHNDGAGTATKIDLGASFPVPTVDRSEVYEIILYSPNSLTQSVIYRAIRYDTTDNTIAAEASGTITTDLPAVTQLLTPVVAASVGGTSSVVGVALFGIMIGTEY